MNRSHHDIGRRQDLRAMSVIGLLLASLGAHSAFAEDAPSDRMMLLSTDRAQIIAKAEIGLQVAAERHLYWNLADVILPTGEFDNNRYWWEAYIEPGLNGKFQLTPEILFYGGLSTVSSRTWREDTFAIGDTGRTTLEEGFAGIQYKPEDDILLDVSAGPQEYKIGSGMLIANGASNGFQRGAMKLGPRKAFEMTGITRLTYQDFKTEVFYLDANELPESDSNNQLAGVNFVWQPDEDRHLGLAYGNVVNSGSSYPKAPVGGVGPPTLVKNGREGLNFIHSYGRWTPFKDDFPGLWVAGDAAYEWNNRIDLQAAGGRAQVGYQFKDLPWNPSLTYDYQYFSGDDPSTPELERFDPLFYEGTPGAWATGSKSSLVFINSNTNAHQLTLSFTPTPKDIISIYFAYIMTSELRSPLQFGQPNQTAFSGAPELVNGVTSKHLSNDIFVKYTRVLNEQTYLTLGYSISLPGKGIDQLLGYDAPAWSGVFANVVVNF